MSGCPDPASTTDHGRRRLVLLAGAVIATPLSTWPLEGRAQEAGPEARTTVGLVRGMRNGDAYVFKGIPYGATTAGAGRFMPPRPPVSWSGVRSAVAYGSRCPGLGYPPFLMKEEGVDLDTSVADEDCLNLNVWTPDTARRSKRPVMVWLHGGGYNSGSGGSVRYDGTRLATRHDVVVVTVNHRLGALGYLYLGGVGGDTFAKSANLGMLDIVQSLEWVRDNIDGFGGDPGNVTIFGESGGAGKVSTLMAMPAARGLFHRAIAESGSALRVATADEAARQTAGVLEKLGVAPGRIESLSTLPFAAIAAATPGSIGPVVDGSVLPRQPFGSDAPPVSAGVPLLMGSNLTEITFFNDTPLDPIDDAKLLGQLSAYTRQEPQRIAPLIALYRDNRPGVENHILYQLIASDWWMTSNVHTQAARKAAQGGAPVYVYQFAMPQGARGGKLNAPHTAEIAYVFDNLALSSALVGEATDAHQLLADRMSSAWTAFARSGNPNVAGAPEWRPYRGVDPQVMVFDRQPHVAAAFFVAEQAAVNALKATSIS